MTSLMVHLPRAPAEKPDAGDKPDDLALVERRPELHHALKPPLIEHAKMHLRIVNHFAGIVDALDQRIRRTCVEAASAP